MNLTSLIGLDSLQKLVGFYSSYDSGDEINVRNKIFEKNLGEE